MSSELPASLDFIVIGAQKAGTTSLWQYLRSHPRICMPAAKEVPFFTEKEPDPLLFSRGVRHLLADAPRDALGGKVTPDYMIGNTSSKHGIDVEVVAKRIASALPNVKLIALLRDPIARAASSYRMAVRRGQDSRSLDQALSELLDEGQLVGARLSATPTNSYVVAGEYGRILEAYRRTFPAEQLLVIYTRELAQDPAALLDRVLLFLGLPPGYRPDDLGTRYFRGGTRKLLDPEAQRLLFKFHREQILPYMRGSPSVHRKAFQFFYETWNVAPDDGPPMIDTEIHMQLQEHFRADAERLRSLDIEAPWTADWGGGRTPHA